jgi:alanyl-tRNA synthetase
VHQLVARNRELERELVTLRARLASSQGSDLAAQAVEVSGVKVLAARLDGADAGVLRTAVDQLKNTLGSGVVVLGAVAGGKVCLAAGVSADMCKRVPAGKLVNSVAEQVGGRGGGRADFAQAGGSEPDKLDAALAAVPAWVAARLAD